MKKFCIKSIAFFCVIIMVIYAIGAAYKSTVFYQNMLRAEGTFEWQSIPEELTMVVLGPSTGQHGIVNPPEEYKDYFFNFCLGSQTPQYDWQILQEYQDRIQPGAIIIMTIFYASPYWTDSEQMFEEKQGRYYHVLSAENIVNVDMQKYWLQKFSPVFTTEYFTLLKAFLTNPTVSLTLVQREKDKKANAEDAQAQVERLRDEEWELISPYFPDVNPTMWESYRSILTLCKEKAWKPVLVLPPYMPEYNDMFPEEFYPEFQRRMSELAEEFNVPWLDYSHDPAYAGQYEWFRDIYHLNGEGAKVFDIQLFEDLKEVLS